MIYTPFGFIEQFNNSRGESSWRGKFDPLTTNEPSHDGSWIHARTKEMLISFLRSKCERTKLECEVALEQYKDMRSNNDL